MSNSNRLLRELPIDRRPLDALVSDFELRGELHYAFGHQFLPAYMREAAHEVFQVLARPDADPTRFMQVHWHVLEENRKDWEFLPMLLRPDEWTDELSEREVFRCVADLKARLVECAVGPVLLVEMPRARQGGDAIFIAVALISKTPVYPGPVNGAHARFFTLEKLQPLAEKLHPSGYEAGRAVVCEWTAAGHASHGIYLPEDERSFLSTVENILRSDEGSDSSAIASAPAQSRVARGRTTRRQASDGNSARAPSVISGWAVISLAFAVISVVLCLLAPLTSPIAIATGHIARRSIRRSQGSLNGSTYALAGLVLGYIVFALVLLVFALLYVF